jgi:MFS family permease
VGGGTFASLRRPAYRRFFVGNVLSLLGFWLRIVVQAWLVYSLTGRRDVLGYVTFVGLIPFALLAPLGGVIADQVDRRRLLMLLALISVFANVWLGVLVLTGDVRVGHVYATAFLIGVARAVGIPTRNAFVRDLVGLDDLGNAIALTAAGFNVARVVGPGAGAVLLRLVGVGPCFLIAAAMNFALIAALWGLDVSSAVERRGDRRPWQRFLEGVRYVRGHRRTRTLLTLLAITVLFTWSYQTIMPAFAKDQVGMGPSGYATLMASAGLGALAGALWVASRARRRRANRYVVFGLVWAGASLILLMAHVRHVALAVPLLVGIGFAQVAFMATANGLVQESVPDALRGRVMGLWTSVFGCFFPLGSLFVGIVAQHASIRLAWGSGALLTALASLLLLSRLPRRKAPLPVELTAFSDPGS